MRYKTAARERVGPEPVGAGRASLAGPVEQQNNPDDAQGNENPPAAAVDIVEAANGEAKARQKYQQIENAVERGYRAVRCKNSGIYDLRGKQAEEREQNPIPVFRSDCPAGKHDVIRKPGPHRLPKVHDRLPANYRSSITALRRRRQIATYFAGVGSAVLSAVLRANCAARAVSASAASFSCGSLPGCTMPADMITVIACSTVMSRSITSRLG